MKIRRVAIAVIAVAALTAAALATGVALGSSRDDPPEAKATGVTAPAKGNYKCKSQACAHVDDTGVFIGNHPGFSSLTHGSTGHYCLQLTKVHADQDPIIMLTPDWAHSPGSVFDLQVYDSTCGINGVELHNTPGGTHEDAAFYITIE